MAADHALVTGAKEARKDGIREDLPPAMDIVVYLVIGLITGALTGFSGASAVVIVVPALTLGMHVPFRTAVGTSLAVDVVTSVTVAWSYARQHHVALKQGALLMLGAMVGAQTGVILSHHIPTAWLTVAFGVFMVAMSWNFLSHAWRNAPLVIPPVPGQERKEPSWTMVAAVGVLGFLIGNISGLIGASGGILFLVALLYGLRYSLRTAIGTGTAVMALSALSGAVGYGWHHEIDGTGFLLIGVVAVVTGYLVAHYAQRIRERYQVGGTGLLLFAVGISMLIH